ncbi:hypothetical protein GCM10023196_063580 [Actinoallomurus vinaceus]|uniref:Uncharacterized protein n=1 Tax=Actinoallomurus vinaceus TaxID=1080074 RepID=A0ABP8UIK9_9ACTN
MIDSVDGDQLRRLDELLAVPFPESEPGTDDASSGTNWHLCVLHETRDFWDPVPQEEMDTVVREITTMQDTLAAALTGRWGEPEIVDGYEWTQTGFAGTRVPTALDTLAWGDGLSIWRHPDLGRRVGLTVIQSDKELPLQLYAVVWEAPVSG